MQRPHGTDPETNNDQGSLFMHLFGLILVENIFKLALKTMKRLRSLAVALNFLFMLG